MGKDRKSRRNKSQKDSNTRSHGSDDRNDSVSSDLSNSSRRGNERIRDEGDAEGANPGTRRTMFNENVHSRSADPGQSSYGGFMNEDTRFQRQQYRGQAAQRVHPKGYTRSDERIQEDICERLSYSGLPVGEVSVEVSQGRVTLDGMVSARPIKHAIEDYVDDCMGVQEIDNRIKVQRQGKGGNDKMDSVSGTGPGGDQSHSRTNTKPGE